MKAITIVNHRKSLGEQVYESLREAIIALELEPGQMIYENELAESTGVSRTPIREAIRLLLSEELLEVLPQRGTRIAYISETKVRETRFVRASLELSAIRHIAEEWSGEGVYEAALAELNRLIEEQRQAAEKEHIASFLQHDEAFHRTLLALTGNETLLGVVYHMRAHLNRLRYLALKEYRHMGRIIDEHKQLLELIQAKDVQGTTELLEHHLGKLNQEIPELRMKYAAYFID